jgi:hypothetical protein
MEFTDSTLYLSVHGFFDGLRCLEHFCKVRRTSLDFLPVVYVLGLLLFGSFTGVDVEAEDIEALNDFVKGFEFELLISGGLWSSAKMTVIITDGWG